MRVTLRIASLALALAVLAPATPAWSARVATARVGQHAQFTRIVFELDNQAGYRLERSVGSDGRPVIVVTVAASLAPDAPRKIRSASSLLESVTLEQPRERTVATIRLRGQALPVKEMILTNPPRIVLDVVGTDTALAARPKPKPAPVATTPAPGPEKPAQVAKKPEPAPAEKPKPAPSPEEPAPSEAAQPAGESEAEAAAREAMERRLAAVREAAEQRKEQLEQQKEREAAERKAAQERLVEQRRRQQEEQEQRTAAPPQPVPLAPGTADDGRGAYLIGAVGGLLLFAVIVAIVAIRRRTLPKDLDVAAFSDDEDEAPGAVEQFPQTDSGSSEPLAAAGPSVKPPLSAPGLFDESEEDSEKGESEMEPQAQDLSIDRNEPFTAAPAAGADVSGAIAELERRMAALEAKLQESNAARERLERQVAAQSEELRVQRAAIARTQRALRGLSRSEEEQATEPALRD